MGIPLHSKCRSARAFSLVEMLVVILLISVVMALMVPAVNALLGISGPRGGVNSLAAAIDNAKVAAMENGVTVYLAFPTSSTNTENAFSRMIIFRKQTPEEIGANNPDDDPVGDNGQITVIPLSRWIALPKGVFFESDDLSDVEIVEASIPPLDGEEIQSFETIPFDRYGRLAGIAQAARIRVGEKAEPAGEFIGEKQPLFLITVQPLTGRSTVEHVMNN